MCVDFRALNKVTARDNFPIPLIEDCISYLGGKKYFTTLDLNDGFFHVAVAPDSMKYTSFVVPHGQFEYLRMPFGLKNAPSVFQGFVTEIFQDLISAEKIKVYIDDIVIGTATMEEHIELVATVLRRLTEKGLELRMNKSRFGYERINYLGYVVTPDGIRPTDEHIQAIKNLPLPKNAKELQRALGLFSYFRMFIRSFSEIAKALRMQLVKDATFAMDEKCIIAFDTLRQKLIEGPVLGIFSPHKETELHCDASTVGFGAVLMQRQPDKKFHPVSYFSQAATPAESRYHSFELKTLAIVYALARYHTHLKEIPFTIVTDCNSLKLTLERKNMNMRIARWAMELQVYDYKLQHRPGTSMRHVDALSRCHQSKKDLHLDTACRIVAAVDDDETSFNIQATQGRDQEIVALRDRLETSEVPGFALINGIVFKEKDTEQPKLYVPPEMETNVIRLVHEKIAHLGIDKTLEKIKLHYWFPGMREKTAVFIQNCISHRTEFVQHQEDSFTFRHLTP